MKDFILKNHDLIRNTEEIAKLLENVVDVCDEKAVAFYSLKNEVQIGLIQCLLSYLRNHQVQAKLMLRYSVETACLCAYSLHHTNIGNFLINDEIGAKPVSNTSKKVYKWLNREYPTHAEKLQNVKNMINYYFAHGNLFASLLTLDKENYSYNYFDRDDILMKQSHIWEVGFVAALVYDLIHQSARDCSVVSVRNDVFDRFLSLYAKNQNYRNALMENTRLSQWRNK